MKKIFFVSVLFLVAMTTKLMAQPNSDGVVDAADIQIWRWTATSANGPQTLQIHGGKGTLMFDKQGDKFSNVRLIDASGKMRQFSKAVFPLNGFPRPTGESPLPDACFATADKSIELCFCQPTNTTGGNTRASGAVIGKIRKWGATQSDQ